MKILKNYTLDELIFYLNDNEKDIKVHEEIRDVLTTEIAIRLKTKIQTEREINKLVNELKKKI